MQKEAKARIKINKLLESVDELSYGSIRAYELEA